MKKTILFITNLFIIFLFVTPVFTQGLQGADKPLKIIANNAGVTETSIENVVGAGLNVALSMVGLIFLILMVYAGYLWMTARGEDEPIKKAQKIIIGSVIGLVLILSAYAITKFITGRFQ